MNWTPKATPPEKPGMPLVWVREINTHREYAAFSYFLDLLAPHDQWTIERYPGEPVEVLFWMDIASPYTEREKNV